MGTSYDARCRTCDSGAGLAANWSPLHLWLVRDVLSWARSVQPNEGSPLPVVEYEGIRVNLQWFAEHLGHDIRPCSEYGEYDDECTEQFRCGECDRPQGCDRPAGHDGPHSRGRR